MVFGIPCNKKKIFFIKIFFFVSFDELLELSHKGNNRVIDMLVGDIYGGMDYSKVNILDRLFFALI